MFEEEQGRRTRAGGAAAAADQQHGHQLSITNIELPVPKPHQVLLSSSTSSPRTPNTQQAPSPSRKWNTSNLGLRLSADITSAASASILVAPLITIIDRSIVTKAATSRPLPTLLLQSLRPALTQPHIFLTSKPFLLIFSLYFGTYLTANSLDTLSSTIKAQPPQTTKSSTTKFVGTSAVNMSLCVYKDSQFARLFGPPTAASSIPKASLTLFALRDSMTIFASFNLPSLLAPHLQSAYLPDALRHRFTKLLSTESSRLNTAQFLTPALMQIFSTPIHLLGLDLYNRQNSLGWGERWCRIRRDWVVSSFARMARIVPAFGVGGVVNGNVRRGMMAGLE